VVKGTVVDEAMKLATTIAAKSRIAAQAELRAVNEGITMDLHTAMKFEREQFGTCYARKDKKEGVAAFTLKREPKFKDK
jgi:enoyl-CoA hydratase/carnithine racemase